MPSLSTTCRNLASNAYRWDPQRKRREIDSIIAIRLFMLAARAAELETALARAAEREAAAAAIATYISRSAQRRPRTSATQKTCAMPAPIFLARPQPISPATRAALCVFGD